MLHKVNLTLLLFLVLTVTSCSKKEDTHNQAITHNVFLTSPIPTGSASSRSFSGVVEEARTVSTGFKTAGQITRIFAKEGDYVRAGQLLAVLDTIDYALGVKQLRVQHAQQASEMERKTKLHAAGHLSDNEYERAKSQFDQLGLQLKLNENTLDYCHLYAPTSGFIIKRNFEPAEMVNQGTAVFEIMDDSHLEVVVDLPVNEYIHRGEFTSFIGHTPASADAFPLSMISLTPRADNNQLYRLRLALPSGSHAKLTPGMNLSVEISTDGDGSQTVDIPARSFFERDGDTYVWVYDSSTSTIASRQVTVAPSATQGHMTVTSGLQAGEQIVRAGVNHLTEGERVNVITGSETNVGNAL